MDPPHCSQTTYRTPAISTHGRKDECIYGSCRGKWKCQILKNEETFKVKVAKLPRKVIIPVGNQSKEKFSTLKYCATIVSQVYESNLMI